jgi:hypothetical protein
MDVVCSADIENLSRVWRTMRELRLNTFIVRNVKQFRLVSHRRFGTTYRFRLPGRWTFWPLKMGLMCSPETSARNQLILHNIPEDYSIQVNSSGRLLCRINLRFSQRYRRRILLYHVNIYRRFGQTWCLQLQGLTVLINISEDAVNYRSVNRKNQWEELKLRWGGMLGQMQLLEQQVRREQHLVKWKPGQ